MRKTLLVSVAAAALTAASFASAQPMNQSPAAPSGGPAPGAATQGAPADIQGAPDHGPAGRPGANKGAREPMPQRGAQQQQPGKGTGAPQSNDAQMHRQPTQQGVENAPNSGPRPNGNAQSGPGNTNQAAGERPMTSRNVSLSTEQKTVIRERVLTSSAPRVTGRVNFDIHVGAVVPRTVRVAPVPVALIDIEPTWRGYMYFVSGDEIIVVEPGTLRIVAVLDV